MANWYYLADGIEIGPLESTELKQLAADGHLKPSDKIRRAGVAEWSQAKEVTGLFPAAKSSDWLDERRDFIDIGQWMSEFRAIRWRTLFPIRAWLKDRPWSLVWVQLFVFAFCFPFLLIPYYQGRSVSIPEAAWAFSLYFAILWAAFLHRCMRPGTLKMSLLIATWFFTATLGVIVRLVL